MVLDTTQPFLFQAHARKYAMTGLTGFFNEGQEGNAGHYLSNNGLNLTLYFFKWLHSTLAPAQTAKQKDVQHAGQINAFCTLLPSGCHFLIVFNIENPAFQSFLTDECA